MPKSSGRKSKRPTKPTQKRDGPPAFHIDLPSTVRPGEISHLRFERPTTLEPPSTPDVLVVIATVDELLYIRDFFGAYTSDIEQHQTGHAEHRFKKAIEIGGEKVDINFAVVVLGDASEVPASTVLMHVLHKMKSNPTLVVSLGICMAMQNDVRLGDVIVVTHIDRYLEQAKVLDEFEGDPKKPTGRFKIKLAGTGVCKPHSVFEQLKHIATINVGDTEARFESWKKACDKDAEDTLKAEEVLQPPVIEAALTEKMIHRPSKLHVGSGASGPLLVDSAAFKEQLTEQLGRKHLCLDMESGGVVLGADRSPNKPDGILVLRAASDFGDGRKKQDDQGQTIKGLPEDGFRKLAMRNAWQALELIISLGYLQKL